MTGSLVPVRATYIWLGGKDTHNDIRSKDCTLYMTVEQLSLATTDKWTFLTFFNKWNYDGSSTGQAEGANTEVELHPAAVYPYPIPSTAFPSLQRFVVLCECYYGGKPTPCNTRHVAKMIFDRMELKPLRPWYGMEQEYVLMRANLPVGWPENGFPAPQGPYYCGNGADRAFGRQIADRHYELCLKMGLKMSGMNAEVTPGQWEFQIGPCEGIEAGDQLIVARWMYALVLEEISAREGVIYAVQYEPSPIRAGDWNGSGMHTNFSTTETRSEAGKGLDTIITYIERLRKTMQTDILVYGKNNEKRLTGKHETSKIDDFTYGYGTRTTSIRIPNAVKEQRCGYLEDRRPASNADPYLVTSRLLASATGTMV